ncbi:hypothetical protein ACX3O0_05095 [Homoserinimonas sp. A447]
MCQKVTYSFRIEALRAARAISEQPGFPGTLAVYPCPGCGSWHLTSHQVGKKWLKFQDRNYRGAYRPNKGTAGNGAS